jgi:hypothetical protein
MSVVRFPAPSAEYPHPDARRNAAKAQIAELLDHSDRNAAALRLEHAAERLEDVLERIEVSFTTGNGRHGLGDPSWK